MDRHHTTILFLAGLLVVAGCAESRTETLEVRDDVRSLELENSEGNVRVFAIEPGDAPFVVAHLEGDKARLRTSDDGDTVVISASCEGSGLRCSADLDAYLPAGIALQVTAASGDVGLDSIQLDQLVIDAGSGNVSSRALSFTSASVEAGSGDVALRASGDAPQFIAVDAGSGNVHIEVPAGEYDVEATSGSGNASVSGIENIPTAPATIDAHSGSGDVSVIGL